MKSVVEKVVETIKHDLRSVKKESLYVTSKETGLRPEVIKKIENVPIQGKAESLVIYIDSYCSRFPAAAFKLLYEAATLAGQKKEMFSSH